MAVIIKSTKHRLLAKTKYDDDGTTKSATRNLGINGIIAEDYIEDTDEVENLVKAFQRVTTDTVQSFTYEYIVEYESQDGNFGTPGTIAAAWDNFDDVKLVNFYTDGEDSSRYTVTRAATGASNYELKQFGLRQAQSSSNTATPINGQYTGSTVASAWSNS